jgi:ketosteroid isomerase-like protein
MFDELGMEGGDTEARQRADLVFGVWNDEGLEAMAERFWHPDIVWEEAPDFPDAGVRRGRDEAVRRMSERLELLGHIQIEVLDARRTGANILIEAIVRGTGSASGAPVANREFFLITVGPDGLSTRFREYLDRDAAIAAAEADA